MSGVSKKLMSAAGAGGESFWITTLNAGRSGEEYQGVAVNEAGEVFCAGKSDTSPYNNATFTVLNPDGSVAVGRDIGARNTGNPDNDIFNDLKIAPDGNLFAAGRSHDGTGADNGIVSKIAPSGTITWTTKPNFTDFVRAVAVDTSSNVYGALNYGSGIGVFKLSSSTGASVWSGTYEPASGTTFPRRAASDASSNLIVVGQNSTARFPYDDGFIVKFNSSGVKQWDARITSTANGNCRLGAVATDSDGNIYAAGEGINNAGTYFSKLVIKFNSAGVIQWQRGVGSGGAPSSIAVDVDGNVLVCGYDGGGSLAGDAVYVIKLDTTGSLVWARYIDAAAGERAFGATVDAVGNVFVAGDNGTDYLVAKLPADGSGTGTYANFVYEAFTPSVVVANLATTTAFTLSGGALPGFATGISLPSAAQTYTQVINELAQ